MSYQEYLAARETVTTIGQPVISVIFIFSLALGIIAIYHMLSNDSRAFRLASQLREIDTALLVIGFIIIAWFHLRIYQTIELVYPPELANYMASTMGISATSLRFAVPLWIETEKLYFWTLCLSIFLAVTNYRYDFIKTKITALFSSSLNIMLAAFGILTYYTSNPFREPLPGLHSEITGWYQAAGVGDPNVLYGALYQLYFRIIYFYNSEYMWTHPPMLFIAYASLVVTFVGCVFMLFRREKIFDRISYSHAKVGYLLLTVGMLIGYPWAVLAWDGKDWWWDPKINGSIMMWVLYSAYLHTRIYLKRRNMWRATAILGIICFLSLVFTYLLTYIAPGIHAITQ
ncbi:MAG: cytochrome c biogenesis protein CcsA [ANME-2 cluster archaeon]|nr:cytochrome c biogenesis protein CcsA [ANME-2 cluster archaeon]MBC2702597.1 cytochrome c biogenesis protein CcsA [ANME-2 cluster archaeon]MBC2708139.1 cytochrome c biogenesis protein CcsA [ANME-2 cluster archaeon]MBC2745557.1 cytochrome c biogenesis protein CcsA [ANME-2 cluster archaeon]